MVLNIFTDMKSGDPRFDTLISIIVFLVTLAFVTIVTVNMVRDIPKLTRLKRELKAAKRVAALPGALTVEGEVVGIREERYTRWDIQYLATVVYSAGQRSFYGDFTFLNRGSLRVGTKIGVLCDSNDPASSASADGSQIKALQKLVSIQVRAIILMLIFSFGFYMIFLGCLAGRIELD